MRKHLRALHTDAFQELLKLEADEKAKRERKTFAEQKQEIRQISMKHYIASTGAIGATAWKADDLRTKAGHLAILRYLARDSRPLSTVDQPGFWGLISHFQPCYPIATRPTIRKMIGPEAKRIKGHVKAELENIENVSFTTDIWTDSTTNQSFISLSAHWINGQWQRRDYVLGCEHFPDSHTGENIAKMLKGMLEKWDIAVGESGRCHIIVRDGAANMRKGCNQVPAESLHCTIHLLQLVVKDGLFAQKKPQRVISKCKALVSFLSHSSRATEAFRAKQVEVYEIQMSYAKQLVKDVETRWNSTYLMLFRIQHLKQALEPFMNEEALLPPNQSSWTQQQCLEPTDWVFIEAMLRLLEPFFRYTEIMSSNKISLAQVLVIIQTLEVELEGVSGTYVLRMKSQLLESLRKRFFSENPKETTGAIVEYNIQKDSRYLVTCLLNPQFRMRVFKKKSTGRLAKSKLLEALTSLAKKNDEKKKRQLEEQGLQSQSQPADATSSGFASIPPSIHPFIYLSIQPSIQSLSKCTSI